MIASTPSTVAGPLLSSLDLGPLNDRQRAAVTAPLSPLLVLAGPGTGKTTVLTARIAYLVQAGQVDPRHLLAVTFTHRAARELRQRLHLLGLATGPATVGTLHAFGFGILRHFADRLGFEPRSLSVIDRAGQRRLIEQVRDELGLEPNAAPVELILDWLCAWKRGDNQGKEWDEALDAVVQGVAHLARRHNLLSFDDLITLPLRLLSDDADVRRWAQERFRAIVVDEIQDLDVPQYRLLALLAQRERNLTLVGDPLQSVYAWRGATLQPLQDLPRDFPELRIIVLDQSYRATAAILAVAASLGNLVAEGCRPLVTGRGQGVPVQVRVAPDVDAEARDVAATIRQLHQQGVVGSWRECAVLYRARWQGDVLEPAFSAAGIPVRRVDVTDLLAASAVRDPLAYLRSVANPADSLALTRIINRPPRKLGALERALRDGYLHTVNDLATAGPSLLFDPRARASLQRFLALHRDLSGLASQVTPAELLAKTLTRSGYLTWLATQADGPIQQRSLMELEAIAAASTATDLSSFLAELASGAVEGHLADRDGVVLSTIHRAKGLEFPVVCVVGWAEGLLPHARALGDPQALAEEVRLGYVALTRARDHLILGVPLATLHGEDCIPRVPSRFLDVLPRQHLQVTTAGGKE